MLCQKIAKREELKLQKASESIKEVAETISDMGNPELEEILIR